MAGVQIEISLEEQKALQALTKLIKKMDDVGDSAETNFKGAGKAFETFKGVLGAEVVLKALEAVGEAAKELFKIFLVDGIKAATEQEKSLKRLETALRLNGNATSGSLDRFKEFANQLQETTGIQDEVATSSIALLQSLGPLTEKGLKDGTRAAADLSSALGIDLDTAIRAVGAASEGNLAPLQRLTKQTFREGATSAETFDLALQKLNTQFGGSAVANFNTFDGAVKGIGNTFEDIIKEFGSLIIGNDAVKASLIGVKGVFQEFGNFLEQNKKQISDVVTVVAVNLFAAFSNIVGAVKKAVGFFQDNREEFEKYVDAAKTVVTTVGDIVTSFGGFKTILIGAAAAFALVNAALLANPFVLAAGAVAGLVVGIKFLKENIGLIIGNVLQFSATVLESMLPAIDAILTAVGAVAGLFNKDLKASILSAKTEIAGLSATLRASADANIAVYEEEKAASKAKADAKKIDVQTEKDAAAEDTEGKRTKVAEEISLNQLLYDTLTEQQLEFETNKAAFETDLGTANYNRLVQNLGQTEALETLAKAKKLESEKKYNEAQQVLRDANKKATERDLTSLVDFEKNTQGGRAANVKSSLATIATLQSSGNAELFQIGKAAALATAIIDGIAAVQKALAIGGPLGFALAVPVAAASAVNIAKIASAQPPGRAEGGFIPVVASPTDTTLINAAPGELVLNRRQQTSLFNAINQGQLGDGGGGTNVVIQGNVIADDDSQVQKLISRINDQVQFRNARVVTS